LSSSVSFSPSLDFPFLFLLATSPSLLTAENFDLIWAGSCPQWNWKITYSSQEQSRIVNLIMAQRNNLKGLDGLRN
jgi:hypothetical protein